MDAQSHLHLMTKPSKLISENYVITEKAQRARKQRHLLPSSNTHKGLKQNRNEPFYRMKLVPNGKAAVGAVVSHVI